MINQQMFKEEEIWRGLFLVIPIVLGSNMASDLLPDDQIHILYIALVGGFSALLGVGAYYFIKDKSRPIKFTSFLGVLSLYIIPFYFLSAEPTDDDILQQEWVNQTIGNLEFDSPHKLNLIKLELPDTSKRFYTDIKVYSDGGQERLTFFMKSEIVSDTFSIADIYSATLESMLINRGTDLKSVNVEPISSNQEEVSVLFSFDLNGEKVTGYSFMYKKGKRVDSIWLLPIKRGFSKTYIDEFEAGIYPE